MKAHRRGGLDEESRRLLGQMVQKRLNAEPVISKPQSAEAFAAPIPDGVMDFQNLPVYRELKLQRSMTALMRLDNPYFRLHEAAAVATTIIGGRHFTNYTSYDYLGLNHHPEVRAAARAAIDQFGL